MKDNEHENTYKMYFCIDCLKMFPENELLTKILGKDRGKKICVSCMDKRDEQLRIGHSIANTSACANDSKNNERHFIKTKNAEFQKNLSKKPYSFVKNSNRFPYDKIYNYNTIHRDAYDITYNAQSISRSAINEALKYISIHRALDILTDEEIYYCIDNLYFSDEY